MIDNYAVIKKENSNDFEIEFMPFILQKFNVLINLDFPVIITIGKEQYSIETLQDTD